MELRIQTEACENLHLQEEQVRRDILLQNTKMLGKRESMSKLELYNISTKSKFVIITLKSKYRLFLISVIYPPFQNCLKKPQKLS